MSAFHPKRRSPGLVVVPRISSPAEEPDDDRTPVPSGHSRFVCRAPASQRGKLTTVRLPGPVLLPVLRRGGAHLSDVGAGSSCHSGTPAIWPSPPAAHFLGRGAPPRAGHGWPVPRGGRPRPGANSGEGRGKRRGPAGGEGRKALICMVSPVGREPTAPSLKVRRPHRAVGPISPFFERLQGLWRQRWHRPISCLPTFTHHPAQSLRGKSVGRRLPPPPQRTQPRRMTEGPQRSSFVRVGTQRMPTPIDDRDRARCDRQDAACRAPQRTARR
jgi:hypothetical protein